MAPEQDMADAAQQEREPRGTEQERVAEPAVASDGAAGIAMDAATAVEIALPAGLDLPPDGARGAVLDLWVTIAFVDFGLKQKMIKDLIGKTEGAVKSILKRTRKMNRAELQQKAMREEAARARRGGAGLDAARVAALGRPHTVGAA